jgi:excisionase family DNA binding protein
MKLHSIKQTCNYLGIGRSSLYALIAAGDVVAMKIGRRTLISDQSLECFVKAAEKSAELRRRPSQHASTNLTSELQTDAPPDGHLSSLGNAVAGSEKERFRGI